jgi:hypothetical protein
LQFLFFIFLFLEFHPNVEDAMAAGAGVAWACPGCVGEQEGCTGGGRGRF